MPGMKGWSLTLLVASAPGLFLLTFFWLKDRYEREPLKHILAAFFLGLYAMIAAQGLATTVESWVSREWLLFGGEPAKLFDAFVLSGFLEEAAKFVVVILAVFHWDEFDEPLDGVVYGVAVSLGFATLENILYVSHMGLQVAWERGIFAVPAHALFGATMGFYVGRSKFDQGLKRPADDALALLLPAVFHGSYDYALDRHMTLPAWLAVSLLSLGLWIFVLARVHRAQKVSPFRPNRTIPPSRP
jgi:RsiW-degrading membrane proteinase PrsW (M82 family)